MFMKLSLVFIFLSSCASMHESWVRNACHYEGAYQEGFNDFQEQEPMNSARFGDCPANTRDAAFKGYREGYEKARGPQPSIGPGGVNIQIGGTQINIPSSKAFYCEMEAFMKSYDAFGKTKTEAARNAKAKCMKENHPMHCDQIRCRANQ
jgi:hypothetical protein